MSTTDTRISINRLITAYRQSQCLRVAAELHLAEHLEHGSKTTAELAQETGTHQRSLHRLLRALAALQVLSEESPDTYALTELGQELRADRLGPGALLFNSALYWQTWLNLGYSLRSGDTAFDFLHGTHDWDYYATHSVDGALFDDAMAANTGPVTRAVVAAYDFAPFRRIADVGGGDGTLLIEILTRHPSVRGILIDRPDVVERAKEKLPDHVVGRIDLVGGSFFEELPTGADLYLLKTIIHDWDEVNAVKILNRCRQACEPGTHLALIERVLPERAKPEGLEIYLMDLNMLVNNGGCERTANEYRDLLHLSGFRLRRIVPTDAGVSVVEAAAE